MTEKGREAKFGEQDVKADHLEVCGHAASFIEQIICSDHQSWILDLSC